MSAVGKSCTGTWCEAHRLLSSWGKTWVSSKHWSLIPIETDPNCFWGKGIIVFVPAESITLVVGQIADVSLTYHPLKFNWGKKRVLEAFGVKVLLNSGYFSALLFSALHLILLLLYEPQCLYMEQSWNRNPCICFSFWTVLRLTIRSSLFFQCNNFEIKKLIGIKL